jgi:transketolase
MEVVLPCDVRQTAKLTRMLVDYDRPVYVRVGRNAVPDVYENDDFTFELGKANTLLDGNDITLIGTGETVWHCLQAGKRLHAEGIRARVIDMHTLKPADTEAILRAARETGLILTAEEHSIYGGLGAIVAETVAEAHPVPVKRLGIPDENAINAKPLEIFHHYGFDAEGIYKSAREMLN